MTGHSLEHKELNDLLTINKQCGSCGNDVPAGFLTKHDVCLLCVREKQLSIEADNGTH